jgi:hypothetical protein
MRSRVFVILLALAFAWTAHAHADDSLSLTTLSLNPSHADQVTVGFTGMPPKPASAYLDGANWRVQWQPSRSASVTTLKVTSVEVHPESSSLVLHLSAAAPGDPRTLFWDVILVSDQLPFSQLSWSPVSTSKRSCTDPALAKPFFCPPGPSDTTPDLSFTGSYTAAGGSNPLYQFQLQGGILFPRFWNLPFDPAINTDIEINQTKSTPVHRTTFDPDSINFGFAQTSYRNVGQHGWGPLEGFRFQTQLPEIEFARTDPSLNIMGAGIVAFDFKPWKGNPRKDSKLSSLYFTYYPFIGMEAGRNLKKPDTVDAIPVDLSHYNGIVRGYAGADLKLALASANRTSDVFSISGSYRVRIPAIDEPLLKTMHQVTTFAMTTRARHWAEVDFAYTMPGWKYLAATASYEYGAKPPFFELVDHSFTIGLKLQAMQSTKTINSKLIQ